MPAQIYRDGDVSLDPLIDQRVAIIGYGSQGRAHALNLQDSGVDVVVGLRRGSPSRERAQGEGIQVAPIEQACRGASLIAMLVPDQEQPRLYNEEIGSALEAGGALLFAHGFNIHFGEIVPPHSNDVILVGPKAPGPAVRSLFEEGPGVPGVVAVHQDATGTALQKALAYAKGIGCTRAGALMTTFAEETETDLFGEQAVLAGGVGRLVQLGFEVLVGAGYQPEIAYFECLHEMKLVVDLMQENGVAGMGRAISDTAEYGSLTRGHRVLNGEAEAAMKDILEAIRSGAFATEWLAESNNGKHLLAAVRERAAQHPIEEVRTRLRGILEQ
jgi:ketol-acid reductoisomerase